MSNLRTAAQQALEALQDFKRRGHWGDFDNLTGTLQAALVEDAMQKFTDVSQEIEAALGCDRCNSPLYAAVKCRVCGRDTPIIKPEIKGNKESAPCNKSCAPGYCYCEFPHGVTDGNCKECYEANAEPVQEPVAWRWGYRSVTTGEMDWRGYVDMATHPNLRSPAIIMRPLYAAPPQRKPLTEEEIYSLFRTAGSPVLFARAIERAHGVRSNDA